MIESPGVLLKRYGLSARKSWGQNFLHAMEVHRAIVDATRVTPGQRVVEIGAGLGTLTAHLLEVGADVWAIERDRDLCAVLRQEFADKTNFRLWEADAVRFDYRQAVNAQYPTPAIVGNLPYHLTAPLLYALLNVHTCTGPWVVMVQREVADRMCAAPGNKTYGSMTVGLSRLRTIQKIIAVPRGAFMPPPKVESAVVRLDPRPSPRGPVVDEAGFLQLVQTTFQKRRKTVANALGTFGSREQVLAWCEAASVVPTDRPERLTVEQFAALQAARERDAQERRDA